MCVTLRLYDINMIAIYNRPHVSGALALTCRAHSPARVGLTRPHMPGPLALTCRARSPSLSGPTRPRVSGPLALACRQHHANVIVGHVDNSFVSIRSAPPTAPPTKPWQQRRRYTPRKLMRFRGVVRTRTPS